MIIKFAGAVNNDYIFISFKGRHEIQKYHITTLKIPHLIPHYHIKKNIEKVIYKYYFTMQSKF